MRPKSVSEIKHNRNLQHNAKPREGTKTRRIYDLLLTGEIIVVTHIVSANQWNGIKNRLTDSYGLALVGTNKGVRCVGIWDGSGYVPLHKALIED